MYFVLTTRKKLIKSFVLILAIMISASVLFSSGAYQVFYGRAVRELPIYSVKTDEKKLAISFDCAWGTDYTDTLLKVMEKEDVKCTFFAVQFWVEKNPEYVKKIVDSGHEIGTHSATHPYMSKLSVENIEKELTTSVNAIESIANTKVNLFRPPYGDYSDNVINTAKKLGLYSIQWSVDSLDWKNLTSTEIEKRVINNVKSGSIVLFHNQGLHTAEALPEIIKSLKEKGFTFCKISDLIYKDNFEMATDGTQILKS